MSNIAKTNRYRVISGTVYDVIARTEQEALDLFHSELHTDAVTEIECSTYVTDVFEGSGNNADF